MPDSGTRKNSATSRSYGIGGPNYEQCSVTAKAECLAEARRQCSAELRSGFLRWRNCGVRAAVGHLLFVLWLSLRDSIRSLCWNGNVLRVYCLSTLPLPNHYLHPENSAANQLQWRAHAAAGRLRELTRLGPREGPGELKTNVGGRYVLAAAATWQAAE